jgi:alpha-1,3-fucosyltransferase
MVIIDNMPKTISIKAEVGEMSSESSKLKIILMWDNIERWWNGGNAMPAGISTPLKNAQCPVTSCLFTEDVSLINQSDVVVFYIQTMNNFPINRQTHQRFVFAQLETPISHPLPEIFDDERVRYGYFNWTMTYRWDSDIVHRGEYGYIRIKTSNNHYNGTGIKARSLDDWSHQNNAFLNSIPNLIKLPIPSQFKNAIKKKTKLVAWFVSHCSTPIRREEYVRQLSKFITIDIFGGCNNRNCPGIFTPFRCNEMLRTDYKFYLALENSWCKDYVTEKLYRPLMYDAVPIVMGGANYSKFAPQYSYINVRDFGSPKDLAEYILLLDKNDYLYSRYFEWKKYYEVISYDNYGLCELCRMAHDDTLQPKTYNDIKQWWVNNGGCHNDSKNLFFLK